MSISAKLPHGTLTVTDRCWEYMTEQGNYAGTLGHDGGVTANNRAPEEFQRVAAWVRYLHAQGETQTVNRLREIVGTAEGLADDLVNCDVDAEDVLAGLYDAQAAIASLQAVAMKRLHKARRALRPDRATEEV